MIKECPTCKRTYEGHSFTFCLADGALLSAPFDPDAIKLPLSPIEVPQLAETRAAAPFSKPSPVPQPTLVLDYAPPPTIAALDSTDRTTDATEPEANQAVSTLLFALSAVFTIAAVYTQSLIPALPAVAFIVIAVVLRLKRAASKNW